jgi:hypothetical protein
VARVNIIQSAILAFWVLVATLGSAGAQQPQDALSRTEGFELDYALSFQIDLCGYPELGQQLRSALVAKVDACPFVPEAKERFHNWSERLSREVQAAFARKRTPSGAFDLEHVEREACARNLWNEQARGGRGRLQHRLNEFREGRIGVHEALPKPCEVGAVAQ